MDFASQFEPDSFFLVTIEAQGSTQWDIRIKEEADGSEEIVRRLNDLTGGSEHGAYSR